MKWPRPRCLGLADGDRADGEHAGACGTQRHVLLAIVRNGGQV